MTLSVVIADDERLARNTLRKILRALDSVKVVSEAHDGPTTVDVVNTCHPDVLFLDIKMPGFSGLEVINRLDHHPAVIFTTAFDEFAVSAFEVRALDYLLKPFGSERVAAALDRVSDVGGRRVGADPAALHDMIDSPRQLRRIFVRGPRSITPVRTRDVIRFEARDDYVAVHTVEKTHLASIRMSHLERALDPERFVRVHRSHLLNLDYVASMTTDVSQRLVCTMTDGSRVTASRARSQALRHRHLWV